MNKVQYWENRDKYFSELVKPSNNFASILCSSTCTDDNHDSGYPAKLPISNIPLQKRANDVIYTATMNVVRSIMDLSQGVDKSNSIKYLDLVKNVGFELRNLLVSVDQQSTVYPSQAHKEVAMAHKVLSKDMQELVSAMRLAQQYKDTTLDLEYRKGMLSAAHVLAMDAKNLLDVVDSVKSRYFSCLSDDKVNSSCSICIYEPTSTLPIQKSLHARSNQSSENLNVPEKKHDFLCSYNEKSHISNTICVSSQEEVEHLKQMPENIATVQTNIEFFDDTLKIVEESVEHISNVANFDI